MVWCSTAAVLTLRSSSANLEVEVCSAQAARVPLTRITTYNPALARQADACSSACYCRTSRSVMAPRTCTLTRGTSKSESVIKLSQYDSAGGGRAKGDVPIYRQNKTV